MNATIGPPITSAIPFLDRAQTTTGRVLLFLFANSLSRFTWSVAFLVLGVIIFPRQVRLAGSSTLADTLTIALLIIFFFWLAWVPLGMRVGYYVAFLARQVARMLLAPLLAGVLAAALPYGLGFLLTGKLDLTQVQNSIVAAGAGIAAALVTAVTSQ